MSDIIIVLDKKKIPLSEVKIKFADLGFLTLPSVKKIFSVLIKAQYPLKMVELVQTTGLSQFGVIKPMTDLVKYDYVARFHIVGGKLLFYALTEKGYKVSQEMTKETN